MGAPFHAAAQQGSLTEAAAGTHAPSGTPSGEREQQAQQNNHPGGSATRARGNGLCGHCQGFAGDGPAPTHQVAQRTDFSAHPTILGELAALHVYNGRIRNPTSL